MEKRLRSSNGIRDEELTSRRLVQAPELSAARCLGSACCESSKRDNRSASPIAPRVDGCAAAMRFKLLAARPPSPGWRPRGQRPAGSSIADAVHLAIVNLPERDSLRLGRARIERVAGPWLNWDATMRSRAQLPPVWASVLRSRFHAARAVRRGSLCAVSQAFTTSERVPFPPIRRGFERRRRSPAPHTCATPRPLAR